MIWIAPTEKDTATDTLEKRLWSAANQLWAGAGLKQSDYSEPILGLIFLRFAEVRFSARRAELEKAGASARRGSKVDDPTAYHAEGVLFLASGARFADLLQLPEGTDIGKALNEAMKVIERDNPQMAGVLPKGYQVFDSRLLSNLLKTLSTIPADLEGDAFGKIYEYFLGTFAMSEGQKGGEFFTPTSQVKLIVEIIEPYHGRILDRACGSAGMFVQSARFVTAHKKNPSAELSIHGQERVDGNVRLARMNLAVHGLEGDIRHGKSVHFGERREIDPKPPASSRGASDEKHYVWFRMEKPKPVVPLRKYVKPMPSFAFTTRLAFNEAENVAELLLIREPERRFYRECRDAGFEVAVHDESISSEQVFDVGQLRLRFTVVQEGRDTVQVRFEPWTATFKGPGWSFTWTQLMFRPEECLEKVGVPAKPV